jgi:hypothetical protein
LIRRGGGGGNGRASGSNGSKSERIFESLVDKVSRGFREVSGRIVDDVLLLLLLSNAEAASMDDGKADQTEQITMAAVPTVLPAQRGALCRRRRRRLNLVHSRTVCTISAAKWRHKGYTSRDAPNRMISSRGRYCVRPSTVNPGQHSIFSPSFESRYGS